MEIISELDNSTWVDHKEIENPKLKNLHVKLAMCRGQDEAGKQKPKDHSEALAELRGYFMFFSSTASSSWQLPCCSD
jgi:hypothetical protein